MNNTLFAPVRHGKKTGCRTDRMTSETGEYIQLAADNLELIDLIRVDLFKKASSSRRKDLRVKS